MLSPLFTFVCYIKGVIKEQSPPALTGGRVLVIIVTVASVLVARLAITMRDKLKESSHLPIV